MIDVRSAKRDFLDGERAFLANAQAKIFRFGVGNRSARDFAANSFAINARWKDFGLGVSLFLAVALVYQANEAKSKLGLFISPVFLFYGYAVRLNALPAILPLAIWSGFVAARKRLPEKS